ncbi:MAG: hypothetical protein KGV56_04730 [Gammaproteobacteria bacterium]|nr:hypothetical protein [Gammaproteobacteria bacterium]
MFKDKINIPIDEAPADNINAGKEQDSFASNREARDDTLHSLLHWLIMATILVGYLLILGVGAIWLYHFLSPDSWYRWLDTEKLEAIRWFITGVFGSQILTEFIKKKIQLNK